MNTSNLSAEPDQAQTCPHGPSEHSTPDCSRCPEQGLRRTMRFLFRWAPGPPPVSGKSPDVLVSEGGWTRTASGVYNRGRDQKGSVKVGRRPPVGAALTDPVYLRSHDWTGSATGRSWLPRWPPQADEPRLPRRGRTPGREDGQVHAI
jgi:hypothetical protein